MVASYSVVVSLYYVVYGWSSICYLTLISSLLISTFRGAQLCKLSIGFHPKSRCLNVFSFYLFCNNLSEFILKNEALVSFCTIGVIVKLKDKFVLIVF